MGNILLGKTAKAMYKLSGKTLAQLSDETGLTIDTINNLFYARIQKPGFQGVCTLAEACGFSGQELLDFLSYAKNLPDTADITEEFTKFIFSQKETGTTVATTMQDCTPHNAATDNAPAQNVVPVSQLIDTLNANHEKQLDRFKATHKNYVDQLHTSYQLQLTRLDQDISSLRKQNIILGIIIIIETIMLSVF